MKFYKIGIFLPIILFLLVMLFGVLNIGLSEKETDVNSVEAKDIILPLDEKGNCVYDPEISKGTLLKQIEYSNSFVIPREIEIPQYAACLSPGSNSYNQVYTDVRYLVDGYAPESNDQMFNGQTFELPSNSKKTLEIRMMPVCPYNYPVKTRESVPAVPQGEEERELVKFDEILLISVGTGNYIDCGRLTEEQVNRASRIKINY